MLAQDGMTNRSQGARAHTAADATHTCTNERDNMLARNADGMTNGLQGGWAEKQNRRLLREAAARGGEHAVRGRETRRSLQRATGTSQFEAARSYCQLAYSR